MSERKIKVALIGNPNSGKSTLFNSLTGLNQKVANFPGVTVEKHVGNFTYSDVMLGVNYNIELTDLPGTYSIYPKTLDEQIPFRVLIDKKDESHPDKVIVIADATNLKRSLFLCSQIIDLKIPVVLVLNMMDMVKEQGINIDIQKLQNALGVFVIPCVARKGEGIDDIRNAVVNNHDMLQNDFIDSRSFAPLVTDSIKYALDIDNNYTAFQIANNFQKVDLPFINDEKKKEIGKIISQSNFIASSMQAAETLERYKVISLLMKSCVTHKSGQQQKSFTSRLDNILTHKVWGYAIFLTILFLIFQAIFTLAQVPMDLIDGAFASLSDAVKNALPAGELNDLIVNGVLAGLGGIVIFVPQIAMLFLFIAILEDTGYMARVSFIMDKLMRKFGLNGRSVIPLISGVACAVPAILATRTIQSWKERLITIFVTPLMSCSARLPVYTLLISIIIPRDYAFGFLSMQAMVMMAMYLIGFFAAIGSALLMKWFVKARERDFFIMELPVYRSPRWKNILQTIIDKVKIFLFDAGKVIIAISVVLWYLASHGSGETFKSIDKKLHINETNGLLSEQEVNKLEAQCLETSYAGKMGKLLEPAIAPLGFDWKIGIALITSFAAREVFVGTMSTIYSVGKDNEDTATIRDKMLTEKTEVGTPRYSLATGWSLMLFYAFAMQCMSTLAVVKRETNSWKWPLLQFVYMSTLAYISSFIVFNLLK